MGTGGFMAKMNFLRDRNKKKTKNPKEVGVKKIN
jgi:hypothetical protein